MSAALAQSVYVRWTHVSIYVQAALHVSVWLQARSHLYEEEQKWECVKDEMQREKEKPEVFWQVMLLRGEGDRETAEGWLISQCSGTVTWSAPAPAAAELNPLNSLRPRTGVNGCLHSLPFTLKHTHTHSSILKQPLIRVIMRNIVPTSSFQGFVCLYWGNLRNSRQKSFACLYEFCGNTTAD